MGFEPTGKLARRVVDAAERELAEAEIVTPLGVLRRMGWLHKIERWEREQVASLEAIAAVDAAKLADARSVLRQWAEDKGLTPGESTYVSTNRGRRELRFTARQDESAERAYRMHWTSPGLSDKRRETLTRKQNTAPDLVVIIPQAQWTCAGCADTGPYMIMDNAGSLCLTCADMDHLIFLPAGNATLTRRAKKASGLSAVVVRFDQGRKRYQRQGILVEESAMEQAEQSCLADEEVRLRRRDRDRERRAGEDVALIARMTELIGTLFPHCPPGRADAIARHTGLRGSGRVGRSAAGRALDEEAITRAVVASIRHEDTEYDRLLMSGVDRDDARAAIRSKIDSVLASWRDG
ncbi:DUF2293 domain-containing protein [Kibdelosporangium phytohabitans]|uniref:DUF2293 domain-containing protein n=1 Tax=Kibdelosporangium phytohabitans TaxID=860235 RepID=A0A0N9HSG5_9PSEU|nr:DUF2293 domain-containing protein [Kibdelosporangium phytohabitans]ALG07921.1 hypothetical protein AOZ06_14250 [Kibdelosporangium phytohabitans]MBE1471140.1 hypothetical protein [Kibdelosporangium phytohabitans]